MFERLAILWHFAVARWGRRFRSREALLARQEKRIKRWLMCRAGVRYRGGPPQFGDFNVIGKAAYRAGFAEHNRHGITLEEAERVALQAERERDFSPTLPGGVTVGLSSGTSGQRGVFLVASRDRRLWAGTILARVLSIAALRQVVLPWRPPLRIAFFLRADSNLYRTVASRRIDFRFFDLIKPFGGLMDSLQSFQPHILIAPATVLAEMAAVDGLSIRPMQVISVAEVLDERDESAIWDKFGVRPSQVYQATEGFLGYTCREGRIHLNEEYVHFGREWLNEEKTRFHPVITDFSRWCQWFTRYRLDDVLVADDRPCACGNVSQVIRRIEGRADEVLRFPEAVFPDTVRQLLYSLPVAIGNYRLEQHGGELRVFLKDGSPALEAQVRDALSSRLPVSSIRFMPWTDQPAGEKQRRIRRITPLS